MSRSRIAPGQITVQDLSLGRLLGGDNLDVQRILDQATDAWGIKVSNIGIKHVDLDEAMIRAIAKQAEAERTRARSSSMRRAKSRRPHLYQVCKMARPGEHRRIDASSLKVCGRQRRCNPENQPE